MEPDVEIEKRVEHRDIGLSGIAVSSDRMRALNAGAVKELASSMRTQGLLHPILLRPRPGTGYFLLAGAHRYHAAKQLGWKHISARILYGCNDAEATLVEIDENLIRRDLTAGQRAKLVDQRKKAYEAVHPETKNGATGRGRAKLSQVGKANEAFTADTAQRTGRSRTAVARDATRAKALGDDLDRIVGTSLDKGTEIDALVALTALERAPLIERAVAGEAVSAQDAVSEQRPIDLIAAPRKRRPAYLNSGFRILNAIDTLRSLPSPDKTAAKIKKTHRGVLIAKDLPQVCDWLNEFLFHLLPSVDRSNAVKAFNALWARADDEAREAIRQIVQRTSAEDSE